MTLMLLFGATAVALAMVHHGVIAYAVSQRRNEVAMRLALGAGAVFWLVVCGRTLAAIGAVAGSRSYASTPPPRRFHEMRAADPMILGGAVISWWPSRSSRR
jgi:hypothetical protein